MMKFAGLLRCIGLFAAGILLFLFQPARASAAGFPLLCRGQLGTVSNLNLSAFNIPYGVETVTYTLTVHFRVNPNGAGESGQNLEPGACAWADRPTNSSEGKQLKLKFVYSAFPINLQLLTQCSITRNCVFKVIADNPSGTELESSAVEVAIVFPANLGYTIIPDPSSP